MRLLLGLVIVFAAVVSAGLWTNHLLASSSVELLHHIDRVAGDINKNKWEDALDKAGELDRIWKKKAGWWPALLDHQEMDSIESATARLKEYVASRDAALSRGQLAELRLMIKRIPEKESITLKNIF